MPVAWALGTPNVFRPEAKSFSRTSPALPRPSLDNAKTEAGALSFLGFSMVEPLSGVQKSQITGRQNRISTQEKKLIEAAKSLDPDLAASLEANHHVIADVVGRRPTRDGGIRLQVERKSSLGEDGRVIVHAYGAGGRGYELSWGIAQEVTSLVMKELSTSNIAKIRPFKL
ncbi:hypothetical protein CEP52_007642 [Fusarium oligoseptatum]|uniref:FAD dependent oxidoreductase domain-containing protein n=1 Tax=Fusarium oligoseptatum TaxID=2604345 RepID=A0A428TLN1_9HYPO|nr:hypothetical protein CEP52_007642 [Fusarium oligoseptatum]